MHRVLILSVVAASLFLPPASGIYVGVPDYYSGIASAGVTDAINGRHGDVIFATDYGISVYTANGTWYSVNPRHPGETAYGTLEPLDTMVTAVALDHEGHLWIGYPGGLQIGDGKGYRAIQDLDLLKNRNINCMVRWGDEIWIATGRAGLHRYSEGAWTWYKPLGAEGLACYTVASMAVDAASDTLVIVSELDGVQVVSNGAGAIRFEPVISGGEPVRGIAGVRADPFGGVYLFNRTAVLHYTPGGEVVPVLDVGDLSAFPVAINDLAATPEGMLLVATDSGIYGWYLSDVVVHITSRDGLRSNFVKKLFVDADGRCWFVVPGNVGYIPPITEPATLTLSAVPVEVPDLPATPAPPTPAPDATPEEPAGMLESIRASLAAWVGSVSARVAGA